MYGKSILLYLAYIYEISFMKYFLRYILIYASDKASITPDLRNR
jgi:hypothetical protein